MIFLSYSQSHHFRTMFLTRLASSGCIDAHLIASLDPLFATQEPSRIARDAAAAGVSVSSFISPWYEPSNPRFVQVQSFIENKLSVMESSYEDLEEFVTRNILDDYDSHASFSQAVVAVGPSAGPVARKRNNLHFHSAYMS